MRQAFTISPIVTAASGVAEAAVVVPFKCQIVGCSIVDTDGIAADNTDYVDADLTGTTGYDSRAANQGALTADTSIDLTLSPAATIVAKGGILKITIAKGGSGKATELGVTWLVEALPE